MDISKVLKSVGILVIGTAAGSAVYDGAKKLCRKIGDKVEGSKQKRLMDKKLKEIEAEKPEKEVKERRRYVKKVKEETKA